LVINQEVQVLPIFLLRINKENFQILLTKYLRKIQINEPSEIYTTIKESDGTLKKEEDL